jgi:hypothetical protein
VICTKKPNKLTGRKCYDHLGGRLGAKLYDKMMEQGWINMVEGRSTVCELTDAGKEKFKELGIPLDDEIRKN